jgi:alkylhydroperoxidase/carboxymuconolactone decarboxylase family protein YurZ
MTTRPPRTYEAFVRRFPALAEAWEGMGEAARAAGPLDSRTARLVKLSIAVGAQREGAVKSAVRHARDSGVSLGEIEHAVALAATTVGVPAAVAAWTWVRAALDSAPRGASKRTPRRPVR